MNRSFILDTNILVLFIVAGTSIDYIEKHKRLTKFTKTDFNLITNIIDRADKIYATPNILTEASSLVRQIGDPARSEITHFFKIVIEQLIDEKYIQSKVAAKRDEFPKLGLTDCALIEALEKSHTLITDDFDLYHTAIKHGYEAQNFEQIRGAFLA
jgi:hypothetical protein